MMLTVAIGDAAHDSVMSKHLTAHSTGDEKILSRYAFLDKCGTADVNQNNRAKLENEIGFRDNHVGLFSVRFNQNGTKIIAGYGSGAVEVVDLNKNSERTVVKRSENIPITALRCLPDDNDIFFGADISGRIFLCYCNKQDNTLFAEENMNEINSIDIDYAGTTLISAGKDAAIRLYDIETHKLISKMVKPKKEDNPYYRAKHFHNSRIFAVKYHPSEINTFLSGGWDDKVRMWDTRINEGSVKSINGPHICGDAIDIKDKVILTGSWTYENSLQIWDINSGKLVENLNPTNRVQTLDGEYLFCCQFVKGDDIDQTIVIAGSGTEKLELVNMKEKKIVYSLKVPKTVQALDTSVDSVVVFGGLEKVIRTVRVKQTNQKNS